jgi:predicted membrane protein
MKKVKIAFWVILIGFFVLVVFQNQAFFMAKQSFLINLYFKKYYTAETFNAVIMLALFLCGFLIAYFSGLAERFKSGKTIKTLTATNKTYLEELTQVRKDIEGIKAGSTVPPVAGGETETQTAATEDKPQAADA